MKIKKILKKSSIVLGSILLIGIVLLGYGYYQFKGKYNINKEKYPNHIGYIDTKNTLYTSNFELCDEGGLIGYYSSSAPDIFKNSKYRFRDYIQQNYFNKGYTDNGYLNLRFHVNCHGNVGNVEVNQLNENYEKTQMNTDLVEQLIALTIQENNWQVRYHPDDSTKTFNQYMYLLYKIENGNVTEIIP
jgi:hypothetical protein